MELGARFGLVEQFQVLAHLAAKYRIKDFATKNGRQLNLDSTRKVNSIEGRRSGALDWGDSLNVELARRDLEHESSERYKGFIVRTRLKRVLKEAIACEEEVRRFPRRYIDSVKSSDGRVLRSNREMRDAFRVHFRDHFARCPDLPLQEFRCYLADFLRLSEAEAASCEGY